MSPEILELIPQRAPIVMVHEVISASRKEFNTRFQVLGQNMFLIKDELQEPALIENIAQSAAAGFGTLAKQNGGKKEGLGFIGSITRLKCHKLPKIGDIIETKVEIVTEFGAITLIKGQNYAHNELLLECEMKIVTGQ